MKKITLFFPTPFPYSRPFRGLPLSVLTVARVPAAEGYEVHIVSSALYDDPLAEVLSHAGDSICVGISAMTGFQIRDGLRIARAVKQRYPEVPIVWGGWHPSILPEQTLNDEAVDIVVCGYGDRTFPELVHALEERAELKGIKGLVVKNRDGSITRNAPRLLEDLDDLPSIPYHLVEVERCFFVSEFGKRTIPHISSYGCPHRCAFCVEPIVNQRRWKAFSAERVVEEWEMLWKRYGADGIAAIDSNFFVDKKRVYEICQGLLKKGVKIRWGCASGRIPQLVRYEPEIWEAMERSGCSTILVGSESGSQDALNLISKDMDVEETVRFAELAKRHHIKIFYSFMVGLPWSSDLRRNRVEVEKEYRATLALIQRLLKVSDRNRFMYFMFLPYPGAPLYDRAVQLGLQVPDSLEGWSDHLQTPDDGFNISVKQKWMTPYQARLTAMLSQYIFGLLDADTYPVLKQRVPPGPLRWLFGCAFKVAVLLVKLRWRYQFFRFPLDYWLFTLVYRYGKLV